MTDGSQFIDIALFAMVAVFLGLRLRSVLGRRTGNEPPPGERGFNGPAPAAPPGPNNVIDMGPRRRPTSADIIELPGDDGTVAAGLAQISAVDPNFTAGHFHAGARAAFEMIVAAFAEGDEATLRPLLSDEVFDNFARAIRARQASGEVCQSRLLQLAEADFVEARLIGRQASVTMRFVSQQLIVVRDSNGAVIEGDPARPVQIVDQWTFARDVTSPNPNWLLVATRSNAE